MVKVKGKVIQICKIRFLEQMTRVNYEGGLMMWYHRKNINEAAGYSPAEVLKGNCNNFSVSQYEANGGNRNFSSQFEDVEVGDVVVLEFVDSENINPENIKYQGIWGVTTVSEVVDSGNDRGIIVNFSWDNLVRVEAPNNYKILFPIAARVTLEYLNLDIDDLEERLNIKIEY